MKKLKGAFYFLLFAEILISCDLFETTPLPAENNSPELIFGTFYGMCQGEECIEVYKLTPTMLFEDQRDEYALESFDFQELSQENFETSVHLLNMIPNQLMDNGDSIYGCPDCHDQGGYFVKYSESNLMFEVKIDASRDAIPDWVHPFLNEIDISIASFP